MAVIPQLATQLLSTSNPGLLTKMLQDRQINDERIAASQSSRAFTDANTEKTRFTLRDAMDAAEREEKARSILSELIGGDMGAAFGASPEMAAQGQTFQYNEKLMPLNLEGKRLSNIDTADVTRSRGFNDQLSQKQLNFKMQQARQAAALRQRQMQLQQQGMQSQQSAMQQQQMALAERDNINKLIKAGEIALENPEEWDGVRKFVIKETGLDLPEEFDPEWIQSNVGTLRNQLAIMDAGQPQKLREIDPNSIYIDERTGERVFEPQGIENKPERIVGDWYATDTELSSSDKTLLRKRAGAVERVRNIITEMRDITAQKGAVAPFKEVAGRLDNLNKNFQNALKEAEGMGALQQAEIEQMEKMVPDTVGYIKNPLGVSKDRWLQGYDTMAEQLDNNLNSTMTAFGLTKNVDKNTPVGGQVPLQNEMNIRQRLRQLRDSGVTDANDIKAILKQEGLL